MEGLAKMTAASPADADRRESEGERKGERTRRRILAAARELFENNGIAEVTMREIAMACGMRLGGINFHYASKDLIVAAVLKDRVDEATAAVDAAVEAVSDGSAMVRLEAALRAHLAFVARSELIPRLASLRALDEALWKQHLVDQKAYAGVFGRLIADVARERGLRPSVDPTMLRMLILGALNWVPEWFHGDGPRSLDAVVDQLMDVISHGALNDSACRGQAEPF